jgi:mutator protein MutT
VVERLLVTAAVVRRDGQVLIARRLPSGPRGGLWEFPGGKVEPGESPEEALRRELREELGVAVEVGPLLMRVDHDYPDRAIRLVAYDCTLAAGDPEPLECAEVSWVAPAELVTYPLAPADEPIRERLLAGGR